jgi:hypothetical protein
MEHDDGAKSSVTMDLKSTTHSDNVSTNLMPAEIDASQYLLSQPWQRRAAPLLMSQIPPLANLNASKKYESSNTRNRRRLSQADLDIASTDVSQLLNESLHDRSIRSIQEREECDSPVVYGVSPGKSDPGLQHKESSSSMNSDLDFQTSLQDTMAFLIDGKSCISNNLPSIQEELPSQCSPLPSQLSSGGFSVSPRGLQPQGDGNSHQSHIKVRKDSSGSLYEPTSTLV